MKAKQILFAFTHETPPQTPEALSGVNVRRLAELRAIGDAEGAKETQRVRRAKRADAQILGRDTRG